MNTGQHEAHEAGTPFGDSTGPGADPEAPPIDRLPNEVLGDIFQLAERAPTNHTLGLALRAPLNLVRVSRRWRDVAAGTPALWTKIDTRNAPLAPLFLARSARAPLRIELARFTVRAPGDFAAITDDRERRAHDAVCRDVFPFLALLQPHMHRCASLVIRGSFLDERALAASFSTPAPILEEFHLDFDRLVHPAAESQGGEDLLGLFGQHTPRLRSLRLTGVCISLGSSAYRGLTELRLVFIRFTRSHIHTLINNLAACPRLEHLTLSRVHFWPPEGPGHAPPPELVTPLPIEFPQLRSFTHSDLDRKHIPLLLSSIRVPPAVYLKIIRPRHRHLSRIQQPEEVEMLLTTEESRTFRPDHEERPPNFSADRLSSAVDGPLDEWALAGLAQLSHLPLRSLTCAHLSLARIGPEALARVLGRLPALSSITFDDRGGLLAPAWVRRAKGGP